MRQDELLPLFGLMMSSISYSQSWPSAPCNLFYGTIISGAYHELTYFPTY